MFIGISYISTLKPYNHLAINRRTYVLRMQHSMREGLKRIAPSPPRVFTRASDGL